MNLLNVRNGNNVNFTSFEAINNPDLYCIEVDNETDANNGAGAYDDWEKDATATYSEDCK